MEFLKVKNFAVSTLAGDITSTARSLDVQSGDGEKYPDTYPFDIRIGNELLRCTNRLIDTLSVDRAQQDTTAASHSEHDSVELPITAKHLDDIVNELNDLGGDYMELVELMKKLLIEAKKITLHLASQTDEDIKDQDAE